MKRYKRKILIILIAYFAGFATAIYFLAPAEENQDAGQQEQSSIGSILKTDEIAKSLSSGMHKCMDFVKRSALQTGYTLKEKLYESQTDI